MDLAILLAGVALGVVVTVLCVFVIVTLFLRGNWL